jgi:hypothetical protein
MLAMIDSSRDFRLNKYGCEVSRKSRDIVAR